MKSTRNEPAPRAKKSVSRPAELAERIDSGDWSSFKLEEIDEAFDVLYARHYWVASKSKEGQNDRQCAAIRERIDKLAVLWAQKLFERKPLEFQRKLDYYYKKSRFSDHDRLLCDALHRFELELKPTIGLADNPIPDLKTSVSSEIF